ncbi:tyrosine-type recombinase/integrase [Fluoribacter gormanii]|uniref:Integrase n=1 Tax=Fluoribacter gormanii TaxID=464 RepID=A0A377GJJ9_9GAMM|nr:site-specific integrase [Fluoribacter gormanii]KTD00852.1 integrase [Fluoribacter gormanii]SIQ80121.1 Integrase [Fluoribacter gormanii]STO24999.1 Prophage CP4-57 integrase [Fluoribacter gormanii]
MKNKLTKYEVDNAQPKNKEYNLSDGDGLFLRVRPSGAKSWVYFFRLGDDRRLHRITLGSLDDLSMKDAREELKSIRKLVSKGIDPRTARAAAKAENSQAITMQTLFDAWIIYVKATDQMSELWAKRHEDRWALHLKKALGNLLVKDVNRYHLSAVLEKMTLSGIKEETRKALTTLNLMLDYGLKHRHLTENPARLLKPKDFNVTANIPRDRALSLDELSKLWIALDKATTSYNSTSIITVSAIKLLILTGARRGEVAKMSWKELDLQNGIWSLPKERTKNSRAHIIYLSDLAISIIRNLQPITGQSPYVFDTSRNAKESHIREDTLTRYIARLRQTPKSNRQTPSHEDFSLVNMEPFTVHDLRRSAATAWAEHLKIPPHIVEKMLNHQPLNKLVITYQRATYSEQQKKAWLAWDIMVRDKMASYATNTSKD